jgi:hypothetical protein
MKSPRLEKRCSRPLAAICTLCASPWNDRRVVVFTAGLARGSHRVCDLEEWAQRLLGSAIAVERPVIVGGLVGKLLEHAPALVAQQVKQRRSGQNTPIGDSAGNAGSEAAVPV